MKYKKEIEDKSLTDKLRATCPMGDHVKWEELADVSDTHYKEKFDEAVKHTISLGGVRKAMFGDK